MRDAERRVKDLSNQLDDSNQRRLDLEEMEKELRTTERRAKLDSSRLGGSLRDVEEELEKVRRENRLLGEEVSRLHSVLRDKEESIKVTEVKTYFGKFYTLKGQADSLKPGFNSAVICHRPVYCVGVSPPLLPFPVLLTVVFPFRLDRAERPSSPATARTCRDK